MAGVNYPWAGYGHDIGKNEWGHDGFITGGWTYQTYPNSQGFTDVRRCIEQAHSGRASLCVTTNLVGKHPNKSRGEVFLDLRNHPSPGASVPVDLKDGTADCWLYLPPGSAGNPSAPNGVQLIFKSDEEKWWSFYTPWTNIQPDWEGRWVKITANLSGPAGYKDALFDATKVIAIGLKVAINDQSTATLKGSIYLDDYVLNTSPPITFDFEQLEVERDFMTLRQVLRGCRTRVVRVFIFADGRASPDFAPNGEVLGFDDYFFQDFDALLTAAKRQNLLLMPVLLDFWWCDSSRFVNGVQLGGHSDIIRDTAKRQTFLDNALKPLVQKYRTNRQILAWDVVNEPEWAMKEVPKDFGVGDPVTIQEMRDFVRLCTETIHTSSSHEVTVGSARLPWLLAYWQGLGIDLYQFHWYDHLGDPFPWPPYTELGLDKPCIIGEVPTATANTQFSTEQYLRAACEGGYHGLLVWSYRASDDFTDFYSAAPQLKKWCASGPCR